MSAPTKIVRVHKDAPETSVMPVDAYLVNEDGTPFTGGSGTAVDAYTKTEADDRFAAKNAVADKLAAGGVEAVTGDTVADVKDMLNKLIAALNG